MKSKLIYFFLLAFIIASCAGDKNGKITDGEVEIPDSIFDEKPLLISEGAMDDIIQNLSSPVEMAALLKATGVPFSQKYLCSTDNVKDYKTSFKRAISLGIFGADLGYLNMYNKTGTVIANMAAISTLSNELKVGQFFDFSTIKRLALNKENLDSLMYISVSSFNNMDTYLRENNRSSISSLIVVGVWIQSLYIATQVVSEVSDNAEITERIGEQKLILNDLLLILKNYKSDKKFYDLIQDVEKIKKEFDLVRITYEVGEPEAKEIDGMLVIVQNSTSHVEISQEQIAKITDVIEEIRNKLISL